jgi:hypothetical protein
VKFLRLTQLVLGFQYESDAGKMFVPLHERVGKFGLTLREDKTRLIAFGALCRW